MQAIEAFVTQLSREPDFDAPELQAHDAADLLLLSMLGQTVDRLSEAQHAAGQQAAGQSAAEQSGAGLQRGRLVVIGDRHGALTLGAVHLFGLSDVRVHQDTLLGERALAANAARLLPQAQGRSTFKNLPLGESLLRDATVVLVQLPRSLAELDEIAWNIARWADPHVTVLAGGRDKHMSHRMNEVLARSFGSVAASRGQRKARVLTAVMPRAAADLGEPRWPTRARDADLDFDLYAHGATFGGAAFDHGSRLLLRTLREEVEASDAGRAAQGRANERATAVDHTVHEQTNQQASVSLNAAHIVDLGCGNGVLAVAAARLLPGAQITATDQSHAAIAATELTAQHAGVAERVRVQRADAGEHVASGSADLVLLNPPFHTGATVHTGVAHRLIRASARMLAEGGQLRIVFNSSLAYRPLVERVIGPTKQLARDSTFTVLAATRRGDPRG